VASAESFGSLDRGVSVDDGATAQIVDFLHDIGLEVRTGAVEGATFLPGITVERGAIVFDPAELTYPGDLLHEAGHLAVKPAVERQHASRDIGSDPAEEMMAIAWSYAAALEIGIPPEIVFHPDGYRGASESMLQNFAEGRFLAVPMLQWVGMTRDEKRANELGVAAYPRMTRWLRDS
jgi:hypothetical protein